MQEISPEKVKKMQPSQGPEALLKIAKRKRHVSNSSPTPKQLAAVSRMLASNGVQPPFLSSSYSIFCILFLTTSNLMVEPLAHPRTDNLHAPGRQKAKPNFRAQNEINREGIAAL